MLTGVEVGQIHGADIGTDSLLDLGDDDPEGLFQR
jgi:hypothetical protein